MVYELDDDPYIDLKNGVLFNLFNAKDKKTLDQIEAELTVTAITTIIEDPIVGKFDLKHLMAVHKRLFSDIYSWAGKLRTVEISKGNTKFASVEYLEQAANNVFYELKSEKYLDDLGDEEYAVRFAHYYSEVNILHPFREGNGRAERAFFTLLAQRSGRYVLWNMMDPDKALIACVEAYNNDEKNLVVLLKPLLLKNESKKL
ncbi:MAG: Fic family protein [Candidatus Saccharibacteria bacterium]